MSALTVDTFQQSLETLIPLAVFLLILLAGYLLRGYLFSRLSRWTRRTGSRTGDAVISATRSPFLVLCIMLGIYAALEFTRLPQALLGKAETGLAILAIVAVSMVTANILAGLARMRAEKIESALPVTSLTENIIRIVVYGTGTLVVLNALGISIAPILATLGVGGLAVALALKDTLSNFFAGFHIIVNREISVGDYLKLSSGEEGHVNDIGWRSTKIKTLSGNIVFIPNAKLTELIFTNYALPGRDVAVPVDLGVHYASDLDKVERVACEEGAAVMRDLPGGAPDFTPLVRFHRFGESGIDLTVTLRGREFADQFLIRHEFLKRIHRRFAKEGIVIPYPVRALDYEQQKGR